MNPPFPPDADPKAVLAQLDAHPQRVIAWFRDRQLVYAAEFCNVETGEHIDIGSADTYDYARGALRLAADLLDLAFHVDVDGFRELLDPVPWDGALPDDPPATASRILQDYATDGICAALWAVTVETDGDDDEGDE